jgi:hypothetical protein
MKPPKGSTIIICFMYATWILYLVFQLYVRTKCGAWLPSEVTYGTAALFIVETVSLARLKMAKEGTTLDKKPTNAFASRLGLSSTLDSFEQDAQKISEENQAKAVSSPAQTRGVSACQTNSSVSSRPASSGSASPLS